METGIIECEIRLPCNPNHTFGSACIATWLKSNNNCPICRHEFFPQIEDDTDEDDTDEDDTDEDEADNEADNEWYAEYTRAEDARAALMSELILNYCAALRLSDSVTQCAQNIGVQARSLLSLTGRSETSLAAASVYLASHLRRQPKSLREVAQLIGNTEGAIQTIYRRFYAHHQSFPPHMRRGIFGMPPDLDIREDGQFLSVSIVSIFFSCAFIAPT